MDELKRKLTDLGQDALRSARKIKDAATLSIDIATEEDRLKSHYIALGKLYYKLHGDSPEKEFSDACLHIERSEKALCHMRKQLASVKGVSRCDGCGREIKNDSVFCPYCGKEAIIKNESCE